MTSGASPSHDKSTACAEKWARYLASVAAQLYPRHSDEDPVQVATAWAAEHESKGL